MITMETIRTDFNSQLYTHKDGLLSFAMSFTKDTDDAADLVQDTLLKAIHYAQNFKEGTNLKAWLYTILRNTFINTYRRKQRVKTMVTVTDEISSDQLRFSSTNNQGENKCTMDDINKALAKLQPCYSVPFLRFFEGYKYHEIADELNIPIGTVKTRIHLARGILKKNLKMYHEQFLKAS